MMITAVLLILTYAERAIILAGRAGAYNLARNGGIDWLAYVI